MAADALVADIRALIGDRVVSDPADMRRYERGYRYGDGRARAVARPAAIDDVRAIVRYCYRHDVRLVVQGANTGLVAAGVPGEAGDQLVVSMDGIRGVEAIDAEDRTVQALAGTRLSELNQALGALGLFMPVDLGSDPSLGGMVAANTGGSRLLRYGDVRRNLLGLEAVIADADATLISDLNALRKDNSRIDLKQLFVGSSGAFGLVTRVAFEVRDVPAQTATALVIPTDHGCVPALVRHVERIASDFITSFEGMSRNAMAAAFAANPRLRNPFGSGIPDYAVLIELTSTLADAHGVALEGLLLHAVESATAGAAPLVADAMFGRGADFWAIRHAISDGLKSLGDVIAFDVSVKRSRLPAFRAEALRALARHFPAVRPCDFGHCGDGGDHFNLVVAPGDGGALAAEAVCAIRDLVYGVAIAHGGSFSAEHGVGPYNAHYYRKFVPEAERVIARGIKRLFDPKGLLGTVDFS